MGGANLKLELKRKFSTWAGERMKLEKKIAKVEAEYEALAEKRDRVSRLEDLIDASILLLSELDPKWRPVDTPPRVPKGQRIPFEHGATATTAFASH